MGETRQQREFREQYQFHQWEWRVQRIGWVILGVLLVLALAGLFGDGPLSKARSGNPEAGTLEYERYARRGALTTLTLTPAAANLHAAQLEVVLPMSYVQALSVEHVTPPPRGVRVAGDKLVYEFTGTSTGGSISFDLKPRRIGAQSATITIGAAQPLPLHQFVYP